MYTIQPCTSLQRHFIQSRTHRVPVCLACTFGRMTRGFTGYCFNTRVEHIEIRVSTEGEEKFPEKKRFLLLLLGLKPKTFWSCVQHSTTKLSLLPRIEVAVITNFTWKRVCLEGLQSAGRGGHSQQVHQNFLTTLVSTTSLKQSYCTCKQITCY